MIRSKKPSLICGPPRARSSLCPQAPLLRHMPLGERMALPRPPSTQFAATLPWRSQISQQLQSAQDGLILTCKGNYARRAKASCPITTTPASSRPSRKGSSTSPNGLPRSSRSCHLTPSLTCPVNMSRGTDRKLRSIASSIEGI